jgi:shikimate kinase
MKTKGISIYLKVPTQTLFNRLRSAQSQRPLIRNKTDNELLEFIEAKVAEREFYYLKSTVTIESGDIRSSDIQRAIADYVK